MQGDDGADARPAGRSGWAGRTLLAMHRFLRTRGPSRLVRRDRPDMRREMGEGRNVARYRPRCAKHRVSALSDWSGSWPQFTSPICRLVILQELSPQMSARVESCEDGV